MSTCHHDAFAQRGGGICISTGALVSLGMALAMAIQTEQLVFGHFGDSLKSVR